MSNEFKETMLDIECPGCGKGFKASIGDMMNKKVVRCPACHKEIKLNPDPNFLSSIKSIQKSFDSFK
ncbi:MAG: hypothetical protein GXZ18_07860 [Synergistaceae bacterium]|nr:hypothetical protein [Synergistaceae bacterium]